MLCENNMFYVFKNKKLFSEFFFFLNTNLFSKIIIKKILNFLQLHLELKFYIDIDFWL